MYNSCKKVIVLDIEADNDDWESYVDKIVIETHSDIEGVLNALIDDICQDVAIEVLLANDNFAAALRKQGWMDEQTAKNFGNFKGTNRFYTSLGYHFEEIDVVCPANYNICKLADRKCLLFQEIDINCLKEAAPELYEKVVLKKKQLSVAKKKAEKKNAQKKAEKSAQSKKKALDKARRLLEAAGELPK
jgi:hypothetical protein